jgi:AraC-like DNA-binding protein
MQVYVSLLGLFVSFLVLINIKTSNKANYYLVVFLILINLFNVMNYSTMLSSNKYLVAIFKVHFMPLVALTGPSLYLYIRSLLKDDASLQKKDAIHLLPAILLFINNFRYNFFISFNEKLAIAEQIVLHDRSLMLKFDPLLFSGELSYFLRSGGAITYMIVSSVIVYKHFKDDIRKQFQNVLIFRWLVMLLVFNYILNFTIFYYTLKLLHDWNGINKMSVVSVGWFIYGVGSVVIINLTLFFFPSILYGLPRLDFLIMEPALESKLHVGKEISNIRQVREFEISDEKLALIGHKVQIYCQSKPYLTPNFTLAFMSKDIGIPIHHLSYYFNEYMHIDFASWKNNARIEYVIELMHEGNNNFLTLDALSRQAGFVSRSTFVNAFKQKMSLTPSDYINSL